jgi:hypothetical protein
MIQLHEELVLDVNDRMDEKCNAKPLILNDKT